MAGHGREPERTANGANQSANGGAWHPLRALGEVAARPPPPRGGKGGRAAAGEPDRAVQVTAGGNSGAHVWRGGLVTAVIPYNLVIGRCVEVLPPTVLIFHPLALYVPCSLTWKPPAA